MGIRTQIKENAYYYFWGAVTLVVVAGQIYVGNGYRTMSQSIKDLTEVITIKMEWELLEEQNNPYGMMPLSDVN